MGRPLRVMPSLVAGLENFTNTRVSSVGHRLTEKAPDSLINSCVRALLSTPTPTSTGSIDNWVIHEAVMPFQRSPDREPMRARAFGIFHVTRLTVSGSTMSSPLLTDRVRRSEEHTSELQSRENLVC